MKILKFIFKFGFVFLIFGAIASIFLESQKEKYIEFSNDSDELY